MKTEQARFKAYADIYHSKAAALSKVSAGGFTPAAKATKVMASRKGKYPENKGMTQQGRKNIIDAKASAK